MPTEFTEWDEVTKDYLVLPIHGHKYKIQPLGWKDGMRLRAAFKYAEQQQPTALNGGEPAEDADPEVEAEFLSDAGFEELLLGDQLQAMRDNNVPQIAIVHAAGVALADHQHGRAVAMAVWERGLDPEGLAASMAAQLETLQNLANEADEEQVTSTSTGEAPTTKRPASTSGTRSRKATPRKRQARKSTSKRSSTTTSG